MKIPNSLKPTPTDYVTEAIVYIYIYKIIYIIIPRPGPRTKGNGYIILYKIVVKCVSVLF